MNADASVRRMLEAALKRFGYQVETAESVQTAIARLDSAEYEIVLTDKNMPDRDDNLEGGMYLLRHIKTRFPATEVIMMTGYASIETATEAMRRGAFDYLTKPFDTQVLRDKIERILVYKSFIDSDRILRIYKTLHLKILDLLEQSRSLSEPERRKRLTSLEQDIDHVFRTHKELEKVVISQTGALCKIAGYAEQLRELIPAGEPARALVEQICAESDHRI